MRADREWRFGAQEREFIAKLKEQPGEDIRTLWNDLLSGRLLDIKQRNGSVNVVLRCEVVR